MKVGDTAIIRGTIVKIDKSTYNRDIVTINLEQETDGSHYKYHVLNNHITEIIPMIRKPVVGELWKLKSSISQVGHGCDRLIIYVDDSHVMYKNVDTLKCFVKPVEKFLELFCYPEDLTT